MKTKRIILNLDADLTALLCGTLMRAASQYPDSPNQQRLLEDVESAVDRAEEYGQCLACHEPTLEGELHLCDRPENCTDAECPIGSTMVGWPHPIEEGCSCWSGEGPTGCMDDGDELSQALRGVSHQELNRILDKHLR